MQKPLVILDFDGTLAPIVPKPGDARIARSTLCKLQALSKDAELAILTGRPQNFVRSQLGGIRIQVIGLHGNRQSRMGHGMLKLLTLAKKRFTSISGMQIERKPMGFVVHYRNVRKAQLASAERSIRRFAKSTDAKILNGRKSFEFLPPGSKTKADALAAIVRRNSRRRVLYIGDDPSDAEAILKARGYRNFSGALIKSKEVGACGIRKISRRGLFRFIRLFVEPNDEC